MGRLENKVAFITGAAQGQGRSHAVRMAEEGADIVAVDLMDPESPGDARGPNEFARTVELVRKTGRRIIARQCDVRDGERLAAVAREAQAQLGRLDILVANAGVIPTPAPLNDLPFESLQRAVDINLYGVWHSTRAVVPAMIAGGRGGAIIMISSIFGLKSAPAVGHYAASKHAVVGLMRAVALELAPHRIRVNSIHPTTVDTPMLEAISPPGSTREENAERLRNFNALPVPWIDPVDVSNAVVFLASDEARYITGVTLPVDAGFLLK